MPVLKPEPEAEGTGSLNNDNRQETVRICLIFHCKGR